MLEGILVDLVPYGRTYTDRLHDWLNNESTYWGSGGDRLFFTQARVDKEVQEWRDSVADGTYQGLDFGVRTKDGVPIGNFGVNEFSPAHRTANLGASIGEPQYWSGGYGTDALLLLVDFLFDWLDLRRVWLGTFGLNARVIRQMEKVGFRLEVRQRDMAFSDGQWYEMLLYGLLRDEWPGYRVMVERLGLEPRQ